MRWRVTHPPRNLILAGVCFEHFRSVWMSVRVDAAITKETPHHIHLHKGDITEKTQDTKDILCMFSNTHRCGIVRLRWRSSLNIDIDWLNCLLCSVCWAMATRHPQTFFLTGSQQWSFERRHGCVFPAQWPPGSRAHQLSPLITSNECQLVLVKKHRKITAGGVKWIYLCVVRHCRLKDLFIFS